MCLALPGKILSIDHSNPELKMAKVSFSGIIKNVCIQWVEDAAEGDYVLAHAGTALEKVNTEEAEETLRIFAQWSDALETQDNQSNMLR